MSDFKFNCPHCKQSLEAPEEMLGQQINCPSCNGAIQLPSPQRPPQTGKKIVISKTPQPQQSGGTTKPCPFCGEQIMATAIKCKHCGEMLSQAAGAGKPKGGSKLKKVCKWIMIVWSDPPLSSIDQNAFGIGYAAAKTLESMLQNPDVVPSPVLIDPIRLIERESTRIYTVSPPWLSDALIFIRRNISNNITASDVYAAVGKSHTLVRQAYR